VSWEGREGGREEQDTDTVTDRHHICTYVGRKNRKRKGRREGGREGGWTRTVLVTVLFLLLLLLLLLLGWRGMDDVSRALPAAISRTPPERGARPLGAGREGGREGGRGRS